MSPRLTFLLVALIGVLAQSSCGDGSPPVSAPGALPTPPPSASPSPTPSPSPSPSVSPTPSPSAGDWSRVFEKKDCPYPDCRPKLGFSVTEQGGYAIGPETTPILTIGAVTPEELARLSSAAAAVSAQNLGEVTCFGMTVMPGMSSVEVRLARHNGDEFTVYSVDTDNKRTCFAGDRNKAEALFNEIDTLAGKYYPGPSPSPSPSASPSPSPAPTFTILGTG